MNLNVTDWLSLFWTFSQSGNIPNFSSSKDRKYNWIRMIVISVLLKQVGISIFINLRNLATKSSDSNAEFRASCPSMGPPEGIKDEMSIAGAESHINVTIFICLVKVID